MLLKWLFTFLAIVWLYQAIRPFFAVSPGSRQTPPVKPKQKRDDDDEGDYIEYEEIK